MICIDKGVSDDCYAIIWSYGEICVNCGCCSDDPKVRIPARIKYCEEELERLYGFDDWIEGMEDVQRSNLKQNIEYFEKELESLKKEQANECTD